MKSEEKERRRKAQAALIAFLKRLESERDAIEEAQQWYEFISELHSLLLKHGDAIPQDYRQRLTEASRLTDESRDGIKKTCEVLKRQMEQAIRGLRTGVIFSPAFIGAVAGGVAGIIVIIIILYPTPDTTPPPVVILNSPDNRETIFNTPTFKWSEVSDPSGVTYTVQVAVNKNFSNTTIKKSGLSTSTFTPSSSLTDGKYYWRVQAVDGAGNRSPFSGVFVFTLNTKPAVDVTPPSAPIPLSPNNGETISNNTPTFKWSEVSDPSGVTYTVQVSSSRDFGAFVINQSGLTSPTFTPTFSLAQGKYYWHVYALDNAGLSSPFSKVFSFTIVQVG